MADTIVREYKSREAFQRDAAKMSADGYAVQTVTDQQQRSGCMRIMTLGLFALVWKPKAKLLVTYHRATP